MPFNGSESGNNYAQIRDSNGTLRRLAANGTYVFGSGSNSGTGELVADLSAATAATINQFRQAIVMQSLIELDARGGTRYVEILESHFNVISPDFRLQRAEFLSSGRTMSIFVGSYPFLSACSHHNKNHGC